MVPAHSQDQLIQTWSVCLLKNHLFSLIQKLGEGPWGKLNWGCQQLKGQGIKMPTISGLTLPNGSVGNEASNGASNGAPSGGSKPSLAMTTSADSMLASPDTLEGALHRYPANLLLTSRYQFLRYTLTNCHDCRNRQVDKLLRHFVPLGYKPN